MRPELRSNDSRGFGLIELAVGVALMGVVVGAMILAFIQSRGATDRMDRIVETRQTARAAIQILERDVRMAGSGWGRNPLNRWRSGATDSLWAITPGPSGNTDSLILVGAWGAATTLNLTMATPTATLRVANTTGFAVGDLCAVTDGTRAHMFQVTSINSGSGTLGHATSSVWNTTSTMSAWPVGGYPANRTQVYKVTILSYRVDSTTYRRPVLMRHEFNKSPAVVLFDVNRFQVWYRLQGFPDSLTRDPSVMGTGVALLDKVHPRITTRVTDRNRPTYTDSVWAEIQPRTF